MITIPVVFDLLLIQNPSFSKALAFFSLQSVQYMKMAIMHSFLNPHLVAWRGKVMPLSSVSSPYPFFPHATMLCPDTTTLLFFDILSLIYLSHHTCVFLLCLLFHHTIKYRLLKVISLLFFTLFWFASLGHLISLCCSLPPTSIPFYLIYTQYFELSFYLPRKR